MKILRGGTVELPGNRWFKFDVELDENDLQADAIQYGLAPLTVIQKYKLLTAQAKVLVAVETEKQGGNPDQSAVEALAELNSLLAKLPKVQQ